MRRSPRRSAMAAAGDLSHPARPAADQALVRELAAQPAIDAALRPLRRGGRAGARGARHRGGQPRRFRAVGRRAGGDGADRRVRAAAARRHGRGGDAGRREFRAGIAGVSPLHAARRLAGPRRCRRCCCPAITRRSGLAAGPGGSGRRGTRRPDLWARYVARAERDERKDDDHEPDDHAAARSRSRSTKLNGRQDVPEFAPGRHAARQRQGGRRRRASACRPSRASASRRKNAGLQLLLHRAQDLLRRRASSASSRSTARASPRSRWCAAATCAAPSSITCAAAAASPRASPSKTGPAPSPAETDAGSIAHETSSAS